MKKLRGAAIPPSRLNNSEQESGAEVEVEVEVWWGWGGGGGGGVIKGKNISHVLKRKTGRPTSKPHT